MNGVGQSASRTIGERSIGSRRISGIATPGRDRHEQHAEPMRASEPLTPHHKGASVEPKIRPAAPNASGHANDRHENHQPPPQE